MNITKSLGQLKSSLSRYFSFLLIHLLLISASLYGQNELLIYGKVLTEKLRPLENVNVSVLGTQLGIVTDKKGLYQILLKESYKKINIRFSFVGFSDTTVRLKSLNNTIDSIQLNIILKPEIFSLPEYTFETSTAFYREKYAFFSDIEMLDSNIVILCQKGNYTKLEIINLDGRLLLQKKLSKKYYTFFTDCFGNIHMIGKEGCQQIYYDGNQISFIDNYSLESFEDLIKPCIGETKDAIIVEQIKPESQKNFHDQYHNQLKKFFSIDKQNNTSKELYASFDIERFQISQSYYFEIISLYNRTTPAFENLITNGVWDGNMIKLSENPALHALISWYLKIESKPIYCPAFIQNDSVFIFDFTNDKLVSFDSNLQLADSVKIDFQNDRSWEKEILQDKKTGELYAMFEKNGIYSVGIINISSGKASTRYKACKYSFPKALIIYNGIAYSIYNQNYTGRIIRLKFFNNIN